VVDDLERPGRLDPAAAQLGQDGVGPGADRGRDMAQVGGGAGGGRLATGSPPPSASSAPISSSGMSTDRRMRMASAWLASAGREYR
jgi:hypothetical protein